MVADRPAPLEVDAAMAARTACEAVFVQGRTLDDVRRLEIAAINGRLAGFEQAAFDVDTARRAVRVTVPGHRPRTAVDLGDQGCVVLPLDGDEPDFTPRQVRDVRTERAQEWPAGDAGPAAVHNAVAEVLAASVRSGGVRGTVVVQGGRLVAEAYADGWGPRRPSPSWSMTKTLTALVTGAAIQAGAGIDPFARVPIPAWRDDARREIRLIDSLRMASGLDGALAGGVEAPRAVDEPAYWSPANIHDWPYLDCVDTFDLAESRPPSQPPGTHWAYKNADPITVGRVTHDALAARGLDPVAFPYRLLAAIGAHDTVWSADRRGHYVASALTQSTPRDWARIGLLMLRDGTWNGGDRLLPRGWVSLLTEPSPANPGYGGLTWLNTEKRHAALPADAYYAEGAFGQATFVFPTHDTVVATLGFAPRTPPADTAAAVLDALGPRRG